ncbi:MAG: hypothetical protein ACKOW3_09445 [Hyphomicrobium sp.]
MIPVLLFFSSAAPAVTIKNRDDTDHQVTITEDGLQADHTLKKDEVLEVICQKGCTIRIDGDDMNPYELEGSEVTTIEGGDLYVENQEQKFPSESGKAVQQSVKSPKENR